jgi:dolichol-phosphate mannosyltransferase
MNETKPSNESIKTLVSIILPVYNEASILAQSIETFYNYIYTLDSKYQWEILIINDGSKDESGEIADELAKKYPIVKVYHHVVNLNLGNALKTGFSNSKGDYVITMDIDMSYSVDHIKLLLQTIETTHADLVLASPYMKGGKVTAVPFTRKIMSKWVNWLMMISSQEKYHTFTCMVRAYRGDFIRQLNLKTKDFEINPEIIYKAMILRARIIEIPAHLDWTFQNRVGKKRVSGLHINKGIRSGLMESFIFRPYRYFLAFGLFIFVIFLYIFGWILINVHRAYETTVVTSTYFDARFSQAVADVFKERQYAFLIGGFTFIVALQFFSVGFLSLQNKRYFEELFHLNSSCKMKSTK